jgi:hypothetical protein
MVFGLSTSHAAATLAIILVGYNIITGETAKGEPIRLLNEDVLNGTILLILISCGVSSFVVEKASKDLVMEQNIEDSPSQEDIAEKILLSLAYSELVTDLVDFGVLLKHKKSDIPIYGLHVIDDENGTAASKKNGKKVLEKAIGYAATSGNSIIPLTRHDSSISSGIVYSIREYNATDIVIGLHKGADAKVFLGDKTENILKRIFETIYIYKPVQPLNTLKRMVVVVPPKAETEAGFFPWLNKLLMIARENSVTITFYAESITLTTIMHVTQKTDRALQVSFKEFGNWDDFLVFIGEVKPNDLFIIISSRKGGSSYIPQLNKLPYYLSNYFISNSFLLIFPKQIESGINMGDIQQADSALIETISEQIDAISKVGRYFKRMLRK